MGKKLHVLDFAVYRWRYSLGYIAVAAVFIILLIVAGLFIPNALSQAEMESTVRSSALSLKHFAPDMVIDLPYHVLQKISFSLFGVHIFSIKLPSLILALVSAIGALLLLKRWFKKNAAILTALVAITTGPFLLIAQSGSPAILYILWPTWILLSGTALSYQTRFPLLWKLVLFASVAMSLYTPLGIYMLVALLTAGIFHPHLRYTVSSLSKAKLALALIVGACLVAPVVYSVILKPSIGLMLLGVPSSIDIGANYHQLLGQYFNFLNPKNSVLMTPVYELATALLAVLGLYRVVTTNYTARSYIVIAWLIMLAIITLMSPQLVAVTFVPCLLLIGFGIDHLIRSWYQLFPRNPYARAAGLIPLVILIASLTLSGVDRYIYGYLYDPETAQVFSRDLSLLGSELKDDNQQSNVLIVSASERPFYEVTKRYNVTWNITSVTTSAQGVEVENGRRLIASHAATKPAQPPTAILTNGRNTDADRFYLYKNTEN